MEIFEDLEITSKDVEPLFDLQFIADSHGLKFDSITLAIQAYFTADEDRKFDPSPYFSRQLYRALHPDVRWSQQDPLGHYLKTGRFEGRSPHPLFHVRLVHEQNQQIPLEDIYRAFLDDKTEGPFHELIHVNYVRAQSSTLNTPIRMFAEFADSSVPLRLSPHPLFDAELYRRSAASPLFANELIDFLLRPGECLVTSPFFDAVYYVQTARLGQLEVPPLLHYLRNWHVWRGDVSLFVDIKFLNHQISRALNSGNAESFGEPLSFALMHHLGVQNPFLHPQNHPGAVERAFPNLLVKDTPHKVPEAVQAASVLRHFMLDGPQPAIAPLVSVVILNYYKPVYTCLSVFSVLNAFPDNDVEIIVVENGGELSHFEIMKRNFSKYPNISFVKMRVNRFFGEGNNIAVDQTKGKYVLFLNNDCFLACDYGNKFKELIRTHPDVDAVGALMLFPDGAIQEYGGFVSDCGQVIQRAKGLPVGHLARHTKPEIVDYASAACLLVSRKALDVVGGFDPAFEPFYYEDTDFCRRLRQAGLTVHVNPQMTAIHIENGTSREALGDRKFYSMVREHQALFARRWLKNRGAGAYTRPPAVAALVGRTARRGAAKTALVYTPFDLRTGGGERYILSAARALSRDYRIVLCSEEVFSRARVLFTLKALGIPEFEFEISPSFEELRSLSRDIAVSVVMGNEVVPPVPPVADVNIFHLQFPFPWRNVGSWSFQRLELYDSIVVNSDFTAHWTQRRLDEVGIKQAPPIAVLNPPVRTLAPQLGAAKSPRGKLHLVTVGRFFVGGHSKRHDIFLQIVKAAREISDVEITATIIGGVHPEDSARDLYATIRAEAEAMGGVDVIVDAATEEMASVLARADLYVHCTGYGVLAEVSPESMEHFGMSIVEALQADCIPVVVGVGGPREIVEKSKCGFMFGSIEEAAYLIRRLADVRVRRQALDARDTAWIDGLLEPAFDRNLRRMVTALVSATGSVKPNGAALAAAKPEAMEPAKIAVPATRLSLDDIIGFAGQGAQAGRNRARVS
jgi:GT2 family glycosyltransferase/glycosyltransferase involved in cell wall biosynthesis